MSHHPKNIQGGYSHATSIVTGKFEYHRVRLCIAAVGYSYDISIHGFGNICGRWNGINIPSEQFGRKVVITHIIFGKHLKVMRAIGYDRVIIMQGTGACSKIRIVQATFELSYP